VKRLKSKLKSKKGFTLIELIVVLAILVVLVAIALPTFNGLIADSKQKTADANARTVYTATKAYLVINDITTGDGGQNIYTDSNPAKDAIDNYLGEGFDNVTINSIIINSTGKITVEVTTDGKKGKYPAS